jgi:competence protein ComEC
MVADSALYIDSKDYITPYSPIPIAGRFTHIISDFIAMQHGTRLLWAPIWFGLGIALHLLLAWAGQRLLLSFTLIGVTGGVMLLRRHRLSLGYIMPLILCLAGGLRLEQRILAVRAPVLERPATLTLTARVISTQLRATGHHRLVVEPLSASVALPLIKAMRLTILKGRKAPQPGDIVEARVRLTPPNGPSLPGGYDRARQDWFRQIGAQGQVLGEMTILNAAVQAPDVYAQVRQHLSAQMQRNMPGDSGAVAAAMITGDNTPLSLKAERDLQVTSLYHLLSVSGFHLAIITGIVFIAVRHGLALVPRLALDLPLKQIAAITAIVIAILYTLFTGAAWPTVRSCIATLLVMTAILLGRQPFSLRLVAFAALIILLWRPEALGDISFQFSFTAISGLIAAHQSPWGQWLSTGRGEESVPFWLMRKLGLMVMISLAAEAAIAPIALLHFHQIGIYGVAANAVAAPLVTYIIMPLGLLSGMLAPLALDATIAPLLAGACALLLTVAEYVAAWPSARLQFAEFGTVPFALALMAAIVLALLRGPMRWSGFVLLACSAFLAITHQQADIRINPMATQVMLRTEAGSMVVSDERGGSVLRKRWREAHGLAPEWTWAQGGLGYGLIRTAPRCGGNGCEAIIHRGGKQWHIAVFGRIAMPSICPQHIDVLIDGRDARTLFCSAPHYIDRRWMTAQGVTALRFSETGIIFDTDRVRRGDRPWVRGLWGDVFDPLMDAY